MGYSDIIAKEAEALSPEKQVEVINFIKFLKERQIRTAGVSTIRTPEEIEAFFRSLNVDTTGYKFDREDANAR